MDPHGTEVVARFIALLAETAGGILGPAQLTALLPEVTLRTGVSRLWRGPVENRLDLSDRAKVQEKLAALIDALERTLGGGLTESWLEDIYTKLERAFSPALANEHVLPLVPERFLEKYRLQMFSREELASMLEHERERDRQLAAANAELTEMDRRKSNFISVAAHQLRTPLTGFKWALELLDKGSAGPVTPEQKQVIEQSAAENEHMIALVEEMLSADRIEGGSVGLSSAPTDLPALAQEVVRELESFAAERNVKVVSIMPPPPFPLVTMDADKMRAVFQNLVENAIRYSPAGSTVNVSVKNEGKAAVFAVTDHGIGIPQAEQTQIFTRFFRSSNARRVQPDGNGLGLFIAKNFVALHGGTIRFESTEGVGTTFFVTLPI